MGKSLREIAQQLKDANKKVQLIYALMAREKHVYPVHLKN
jgi:hypothetical protein